MRIERGDLWKLWEQGHKLVITTNVGWDLATKVNNMGAGMALQAAQRWPWLPRWYGEWCWRWVMQWGKERYGSVRVARLAPVVELDHLRLVFLPVKPLLDFRNPELSWDQRARLDAIMVGCGQLRQHHGTIAFGLPGCGHGGLSQEDVLPILQERLGEDRFILCDRQLRESSVEARAAGEA